MFRYSVYRRLVILVLGFSLFLLVCGLLLLIAGVGVGIVPRSLRVRWNGKHSDDKDRYQDQGFHFQFLSALRARLGDAI